MPIGHISLPTTPATYKPMREFYLAALKPLGYTAYFEKEGVFLGLQRNRDPDFWLHGSSAGSSPGEEERTVEEMKLVDGKLTAEENRKRIGQGRTHVAFSVGRRWEVDGWYRAAVKAGGIPNGEPGERQYVKGYYAAFVLDPVGNNIEVVCFNPWWMKLLNAAPGVAIAVAGAVAGQVALGYAKGAGWV